MLICTTDYPLMHEFAAKMDNSFVRDRVYCGMNSFEGLTFPEIIYAGF